jgi:hypothetical protein
MGRDFEVSSYFPHVALSDRLLRTLFRDLAGAGLRAGTRDADPYPVLDYLQPTRDGAAVRGIDPEELLRARTGALPRGYGVIPLLGEVPGLRDPVTATLRFERRSSRWPELDGVHFRVDDAGLRLPRLRSDDTVAPGWAALLRWYGALCEVLRVAYGYGDWEDLFLQNAIPPSRADVLAGRVDLLFRLNCFGPALLDRFGRVHVLTTPAQAVVRLRYGGVLVGAGLEYESTGGDQFRRTASHLGLRARPADAAPPDE